jgi:hypothetical protein
MGEVYRGPRHQARTARSLSKSCRKTSPRIPRQAISSFADGPKRHQLVSAFAEDRDGNIWMRFWGTDGGELLRYDGRQFTRFRFPAGAPATIFALLADHNGRLWIATDGTGLAVLENPGQAPFHPRTYDTSSLLDARLSDKAVRVFGVLAPRAFGKSTVALGKARPRA